MNTPKDNTKAPETVMLSSPAPENTTLVPSTDMSNIQDKVNLEIHLNRLAAQKPLVEKTNEKAEIKEHREIDYREALKYLLLSAIAEKIDLESLIVTEVQYDKNHKLLGIIAKSATNEKGIYIELTYKIKQSDASNVTTNIDASTWDIHDPDFPLSGEVRAEYTNQKWTVLK